MRLSAVTRAVLLKCWRAAGDARGRLLELVSSALADKGSGGQTQIRHGGVQLDGAACRLVT
eukprot:2938589-Pyramimonas_sp.AAC.1